MNKSLESAACHLRLYGLHMLYNVMFSRCYTPLEHASYFDIFFLYIFLLILYAIRKIATHALFTWAFCVHKTYTRKTCKCNEYPF